MLIKINNKYKGKKMTNLSKVIEKINDIRVDTKELQSNLTKIDVKHRDAARKIISASKALEKALKEFNGAYDPSDKTNYSAVMGAIAKVCPKVKSTVANHGGSLYWDGLKLSQVKSLIKDGLVHNTVRDNQGYNKTENLNNFITKLSKAKVPYTISIHLFMEEKDDAKKLIDIAYVEVKKNDLQKIVEQTKINEVFFEIK